MCCGIYYRHSCSPEDEPYWLWWSSLWFHLAPSAGLCFYVFNEISQHPSDGLWQKWQTFMVLKIWTFATPLGLTFMALCEMFWQLFSELPWNLVDLGFRFVHLAFDQYDGIRVTLIILSAQSPSSYRGLICLPSQEDVGLLFYHPVICLYIEKCCITAKKEICSDLLFLKLSDVLLSVKLITSAGRNGSSLPAKKHLEQNI